MFKMFLACLLIFFAFSPAFVWCEYALTWRVSVRMPTLSQSPMVGVLVAEFPAMIGVLTALPSSAKFPELIGVVGTSLSCSAKLSAWDRMLILVLLSSAKFSDADSASSSGDADELNA